MGKKKIKKSCKDDNWRKKKKKKSNIILKFSEFTLWFGHSGWQISHKIKKKNRKRINAFTPSGRESQCSPFWRPLVNLVGATRDVTNPRRLCSTSVSCRGIKCNRSLSWFILLISSRLFSSRSTQRYVSDFFPPLHTIKRTACSIRLRVLSCLWPRRICVINLICWLLVLTGGTVMKNLSGVGHLAESRQFKCQENATNKREKGNYIHAEY